MNKLAILVIRRKLLKRCPECVDQFSNLIFDFLEQFPFMYDKERFVESDSVI